MINLMVYLADILVFVRVCEFLFIITNFSIKIKKPTVDILMSLDKFKWSSSVPGP